MLVGAASFAADTDLAACARRMAARAALPGEQATQVHADGGLWLHAVGPVATNRAPLALDEAGISTYLFGDACRIPGLRAGVQVADLRTPELLDVPLRWLTVRWSRVSRRLSLTTDRLGLLWLYYARVPGGVLFAGHYGALARELRPLLRLDWDTALLELAYGYTPDERTLFEPIRMAPPGATLELDDTGTRVDARRAPRYTDRGASLSPRQKTACLDDLYASIRSRLDARVEGLVISLSAGFDSRYALGFLHERLRGTRALTFGNPDSDEVRGAWRVAADAGLDSAVFDIPAGDWRQWRRDIEALGNAGMTQWSGWAESWLNFVAAHGPLPVIGYLGDALSGKHLGAAREHADWVAFWQEWSTAGGWADSVLLPAQERQRVREVGRERLAAAVAPHAFAFAHQAAMHLDLYGRQRRWVATQPNLMACFCTPVAFFYDEALIDFWASLPIDDLVGQRLYLEYARQRFPRLFAPPAAPPGLSRRLLGKAMRVATGTDQARPTVVDARRYIVPNRARILELIERVQPVVEDRIDLPALRREVERFGESSVVTGTMLARAVNLFLLLDACVTGGDDGDDRG
jgi:hypothetical protein